MIKLPPLHSVNLKTEIIGGLTTFLTMSYIVIINPAILSTDGTGMSFTGVLTATILISFFATFLMGFFANLPFAMAPGMGINAFFTFSLILSSKISWETSLGIIFWSGIVFLLISLTKFREKIITEVPKNLQLGASVGIGLFLTFIGLKNAGIIVSDPVTFVKMGTISFQVLISFIGLIVIAIFSHRKSPFSFLIGIFIISIASFFYGDMKLPSSLIKNPDFSSVFFKLDIIGALKLSYIPIIASFLLTDLFDSVSTFVGVSRSTDLVEKSGNPKNMKEALFVDSLGTLFSSFFGTSSATTYIESASGIEAGAKTGWSAIFCAFCFLPLLFLSPILSVIPMYATAPVLIYVGAKMFLSVQKIDFEIIDELIPTFLVIILIPLTFSITKGIMAGFGSYVLIRLIERKKISPTMIILGLLSVILFYIEN